MSCRDLVELVTAYFDGTLPPADRDAFEMHLAHCPDCALYLGQMRATIRLARDPEALEQRPEVTALLAEFREWRNL